MTAVIRVFLLVMLLHPEVQQRAQQEIDQVIGNDRLPSLQDREALPYVEAILLECLRWYPVIPSGSHNSSLRRTRVSLILRDRCSALSETR